MTDDVRAWIEHDPDPAARAELEELLTADDHDELAERFAGPLLFGTAGLRGPLRAGPNGMNRAVVRRATAGIAGWLESEGERGVVVIGRDARHGSEAFAADAAGVLKAAGFDVRLLAGPVPTPLVAYGVAALDAVAGIVITASHNPPADNGLKLYLRGGAQLTPPTDSAVEERIAAAPPADEIELAPVEPVGTEELTGRYLDAVAGLRSTDHRGEPLAYSAMHGVGGRMVLAAFERAGLAAPVPVAEQFEPDPDFPTVAFPNPEEPGAMDAVIDLARRAGAPAALAHDPDADRLAVAVPGPDGAWSRLSGDQVGVLLADHVLSHGEGEDRLVVTTVVSSTMLRGLAAARGVEYAETLTGFKWLARAARERAHLRFVLGYEEALGYSVGGLVADKDGISAALIVAEMVAELAERGATLVDRWAELEAELGRHRTRQWSLRADGLDGAERIGAVMDRLRSDPPASVGPLPVVEVEDLAEGGRFPPTDAVVLHGDGGRIVVRPSGTEPKLKAYVELVDPADGALDATVEALADRLGA